MSLVVIKLGGSLAETGVAQSILSRLRDSLKSPFVIVPGGGVFADTVRDAQRMHQFSDSAAHHMALLSMHCMARMWVDLVPGYEMVEDETSMHACWARRIAPIWCPEHMVLADAAIPASWDVSSDSLAVWLADRMRATQLLIVKSCEIPIAWKDDAQRLVTAGVVDPAFARACGRVHCNWAVVHFDEVFEAIEGGLGVGQCR